MRKIIFCAKVVLAFVLAVFAAVYVDEISAYKYADVSGFFAGGILSAYLLGIFDYETKISR